MSGTDISNTAVSNGTITIEAVTGDIVITASATATSSGGDTGGGDTDTTLLYSLPEETVFNGTSTYIDTGVALLSIDQDFTIA